MTTAVAMEKPDKHEAAKHDGFMKALVLRGPYHAVEHLPIPKPGYATHRYSLSEIVDAYELFSKQRDGVLKIAIKP